VVFSGASRKVRSRRYEYLISEGETVTLSGAEEEKCDVHHNWFLKHAEPEKAVNGEGTNVFDNAYDVSRRPPSDGHLPVSAERHAIFTKCSH